MSKCNCEWCVRTSPAIAWMKNNAPHEHYEAIGDALQHKEVIETDAAMYSGVKRERDRLQEELNRLIKQAENQQDDHR